MICKNTIGSYGCYPPGGSSSSKRRPWKLFLLIGAWWLWAIVQKRKEIKLKEKFFKRNGGLLLQQQLTSFEASHDQSRLFSSRELDQATEHFNVNRILGQGGQGTVYKGMLTDGRIIALWSSNLSSFYGQKPTSITRIQDGLSLITYFIDSMDENSLNEILDNQVSGSGKKEEIMAIANIAKKVYKLKWRKRPAMKEVANGVGGDSSTTKRQ
ncbi:hypothetical protein Dsin_032068 [Dipteronia sinensis]|uniref:Uncharacterized protein n=1 Tax=Dipteronia sinensis TaxID=43782 RepID=A0AAD9ZMM3_9ROSI|nr:hypothetical protein Dsin_032068 [Dipteronia sinensis]